MWQKILPQVSQMSSIVPHRLIALREAFFAKQAITRQDCQLALRKPAGATRMATGLLRISISIMTLRAPSAIWQIPSMPANGPSVRRTRSPALNSRSGSVYTDASCVRKSSIRPSSTRAGSIPKLTKRATKRRRGACWLDNILGTFGTCSQPDFAPRPSIVNDSLRRSVFYGPANYLITRRGICDQHRRVAGSSIRNCHVYRLACHAFCRIDNLFDPMRPAAPEESGVSLDHVARPTHVQDRRRLH